MRLTKLFSLLLAAALQAMPLLRAVLPETQIMAPSSWAVVMKLAAGAFAYLGFDAVSSATTFSALPATATSGVPYSAVCVLSTVYSPHSWSVNGVGCAPVTVFPGVQLKASASAVATMSGTPTQTGTFTYKLQSWESSCSGQSAISQVYSITVVAGAATAPSITTPLVSQSVIAGKNAVFTVAAGGTAPLGYRWKFTNAFITGATGTTLTITNAQPANAGSYSVIVTNSAGAATNTATLTVNVPASITSGLTNQTLVVGTNLTLAVTAAGTAPLTYFWRSNGVAMSGATSSTLLFSNLQTNTAATYAAVVTNAYGAATNSMILTVLLPPSIVAQPQRQIIPQGSNVTFSVGADGSSLSYRWLFAGASLTNPSAASLNLLNVTASQSGNYAVVISNAVGNVTSSNAQLLVVSPIAATNAPRLQPPLNPAPGQLGLSFVTAPGYAYRVESVDTLAQTNWTLISNVPPYFNPSNVTLIDFLTNAPQRFYRLKVSP